MAEFSYQTMAKELGTDFILPTLTLLGSVEPMKSQWIVKTILSKEQTSISNLRKKLIGLLISSTIAQESV